MTAEICEVVITAPDADWLATFTQRLVAERLAAAGHNIAPIRSLYRWRGQIHDETEARVALHTRAALVARITHLVEREHPFEIPCVVATPIVGGNPAYIEWVLSETAA